MHGADYLGVGPMFPTNTKEDLNEIRGPIVIQEIRDHGIEVPIVGIGGITTDSYHSVMQAGANGIAVISAITKQGNPYNEALHFKKGLMSFWKKAIK
jgi:thiamine-phosphate pyrophosphorylase